MIILENEALISDKLRLETRTNFLTSVNFPLLNIIPFTFICSTRPKKYGCKNTCKIIELSVYFLDGSIYKGKQPSLDVGHNEDTREGETYVIILILQKGDSNFAKR